MKLSLTSVTIRNFKRRLGSCSNKGDITIPEGTFVNWTINVQHTNNISLF